MMKTRKTPSRKCTGCQEVKDKRELIRVVRDPEGKVSLDRTGRKAGRGAYICDDPVCLEKAIKTRALSRSLDTAIGEDVYRELREAISSHE